MTPRSPLSRRDLLRRLGATLASWRVVLPTAACTGTTEPTVDNDPTDSELAPGSDLILTKHPWLSVTGPDSVRLRFETRDVPAAEVSLSDGEQVWKLTPTRQVTHLLYARSVPANLGLMPDDAGPHAVQDVTFASLVPGETYSWSLATSTGPQTGTFIAPPTADTPFRFAFLADTMAPFSADVIALLATAEPHLTVHGGDLEYETAPLDSWSEAIRALQPLTRTGPFHLAVGNHERATTAELEEMFDRLFGREGAGLPLRYHAFTYGRVRFLVLDSEIDGLYDPASPQLLWLTAELQAAGTAGQTPIAVFHRPFYTFSKYFQAHTAMEDNLVPLFERYGVRLVLSGHVHGFEHFERNGVHYVVDGGGGALTYDLEERLDDVEKLRPELIPARKFASRTQGGSVVHVAADGSMRLERLLTTTGAVQYTIEIEAV
jgi:hypothetical protein